MGFGLLDSAKSKASSKVSGLKDSLSNAANTASQAKAGFDAGYNTTKGLLGKAQGLKDTATGLASKAGVGGLTGGEIGGLTGGGSERYVSGQGKKRTQYPDPEQVSREGLVRLENYLFVVEINGIQDAIFEECSGLEITNSIIELNEGGNNTGSLKFYDRTHYSNIVLRRGVTNDTQLYDWIKNFVEDPSSQEKRDASIVIMTLDNLEICRINLFGVLPVRWSIPKLRANTGYPVEYVELAIEDAKIDDGSGS